MRISILGVGRLGASHAATLAALPGVSRVTVYDADAARAKDIATPLQAKVAATIDEAFKEADAMVIVTPTPTHAPLMKRAIDQGLPTFCEKPIAMELAERGARDHGGGPGGYNDAPPEQGGWTHHPPGAPGDKAHAGGGAPPAPAGGGGGAHPPAVRFAAVPDVPGALRRGICRRARA